MTDEIKGGVFCFCPVSESLIKAKNEFHENQAEINQGILSFIPDLNTPFKVIYNGLDIDFWTDNYSTKIKNSFLAVFSEKQFYLKGGDLIFEMAKRFPSFTFKIAGMYKPSFNVPHNVHFLGIISKEKLKIEYHNSEYYFQLSAFEGFGLSLCEAMLCGCIPIGSSVNMIPDIIGQSGYVLKRRNPHELECIIKDACKQNKVYNSNLAKMAKERVNTKFDLIFRENKLLNTIENSIK